MTDETKGALYARWVGGHADAIARVVYRFESMLEAILDESLEPDFAGGSAESVVHWTREEREDLLALLRLTYKAAHAYRAAAWRCLNNITGNDPDDEWMPDGFIDELTISVQGQRRHLGDE